MTNRYAVVDTAGNVVNVILADETFNPGEGLTLILLSDADPYGPGDRYDGARFYRRPQLYVTSNPAAVNDIVTVTAVLQPDTPDTEVIFQVEGGTPITEPVSNGQAEHAFAFASPGAYRITVSSVHHGTARVEVTVQ